jgi:hypothetical protein
MNLRRRNGFSGSCKQILFKKGAMVIARCRKNSRADANGCDNSRSTPEGEEERYKN